MRSKEEVKDCGLVWWRGWQRLPRFDEGHRLAKALLERRFGQSRCQVRGNTTFGHYGDFCLALPCGLDPRAHDRTRSNKVHATTRQHIALIAMFFDSIAALPAKDRHGNLPRLVGIDWIDLYGP